MHLPLLALLLLAPPAEPPKVTPVKATKVAAKAAPKVVASSKDHAEKVVVTPAKTTVTLNVKPAVNAQDGSFFWDVSPGNIIDVKKENANQLVFDGPAAETTYQVKWTWIPKSGDQVVSRTSVKAGKGPQPPPGPTPPGPTPPGPTPPQPGMIDAPGFHVLIKYNRDDFLRPLLEQSILFSEADGSVRTYLRSKCPPMPDGGQGWRFYPSPAEGVQPPWLAPYDRHQNALPVAVISKNGKGWEGPITGMSSAAFIAKCKEVEALP